MKEQKKKYRFVKNKEKKKYISYRHDVKQEKKSVFMSVKSMTEQYSRKNWKDHSRRFLVCSLFFRGDICGLSGRGRLGDG